MPTILSQKIKENEIVFREKFPPPMLLGQNQEQLGNFFSSSTIDILDTIEKWCDEKRKKVSVKSHANWGTDLDKRDKIESSRKGFNSALTLVVKFIKQTKQEIL